TVILPSNLAPGRYYLNVADSATHIGLNMTGSPTVTPVGSPWFWFSPQMTVPGGSVSFLGSGFGASSGAVGIVGLDKNQNAAILGFATLANGSFSTTLNLPASLAPQNSYQVFVKDTGSKFAMNTVGPLTVVNAAGGTNVPVGAFPIGAAVDPVTNR